MLKEARGRGRRLEKQPPGAEAMCKKEAEQTQSRRRAARVGACSGPRLGIPSPRCCAGLSCAFRHWRVCRRWPSHRGAIFFSWALVALRPATPRQAILSPCSHNASESSLNLPRARPATDALPSWSSSQVPPPLHVRPCPAPVVANPPQDSRRRAKPPEPPNCSSFSSPRLPARRPMRARPASRSISSTTRCWACRAPSTARPEPRRMPVRKNILPSRGSCRGMTLSLQMA